MHKIAKATLGIGAVILMVGMTVFTIGGAAMDLSVPSDSEDWSGTLLWNGTTPATYSGELTWTSTYNVWVEEGSNVSVEVVNGDKNNLWETCEELDDCDIFDEDGKIPGYTYIGEVYIEDTGTYDVKFTSEDGEPVEVMIRDDTSFGGFFGMLSGVGLCCGGMLILMLGGIFTFTLKEKPETKIEPNINLEQVA